MPLRISLRPGERFVVNGAIVKNGVRGTDLLLCNRVSVLIEKDIMQPEEAQTPARRIYFPIMLMYLDEGRREDAHVELVARAQPHSLRDPLCKLRPASGVELVTTHLVIEVEDDGPGISDARKDTMLEPFVRGDDARNMDANPGFGLGLSIANAIVLAHGGGTLPMLAGRLDLGETDHQRARGFRLLQDPHRDLGDDTEQAFRPRDDAHQVIARGFRGLAAYLQDFARDQHDFAAQHIVGGHAVFQAMHAAGILGDIAADRAGYLRRWIGRVIETLICHSIGNSEIGDAGLDHAVEILGMDGEDPVHAQQIDRDAAAGGVGVALERGADAEGDHRHAVGGADLDHVDHVGGGNRYDVSRKRGPGRYLGERRTRLGAPFVMAVFLV